MNKPNYTPESIEVRVAAMEEDMAQPLEEFDEAAKQGKPGKAVVMTATVIPEVRYLYDKLVNKRRQNGTEGESLVNKPLKEIEGRLLKLEANKSSIRSGRFMRIPVSIVRDMRYLLDGLDVDHSAKAQDNEALWEEAMTTGVS